MTVIICSEYFVYYFIIFLGFLGKGVNMEEQAVSVYYTLTSGLFSDLLSSITSNLGVLWPVGLTIMGIMVAVSLIPIIVYKFL